jgi:hypothetical protein
MVNIPDNVLNLVRDRAATKVLVTSSKNAQPHAIVVGSAVAPVADMLMVGEILMKVSSKNLSENPNAAFLVFSGKESFEIRCTANARLDSGPEVEAMNNELKAIGLKAAAVWTFKVEGVYDQCASPTAGKKLA